jgi:hypothetical protein
MSIGKKVASDTLLLLAPFFVFHTVFFISHDLSRPSSGEFTKYTELFFVIQKETKTLCTPFALCEKKGTQRELDLLQRKNRKLRGARHAIFVQKHYSNIL